MPLIVRFPAAIQDDGGIPSQLHYVTDIAPTILEILDVAPRAHYRGYDQMPIAGTSPAYTLGDGDRATRKPIQHFEMMGKRGLWHAGWKAVARHESGGDYGDDVWELYHLDQDWDATLGFAYNVLGSAALGRGATALPNGRVTVGVVFEPGDNDAGTFMLLVEGREVGSIGISNVTRISKMRGVEVGRDGHSPISDVYDAPFEFTGTIHSVDVLIADEPAP